VEEEVEDLPHHPVPAGFNAVEAEEQALETRDAVATEIVVIIPLQEQYLQAGEAGNIVL
jgi:hypothetical protein